MVPEQPNWLSLHCDSVLKQTNKINKLWSLNFIVVSKYSALRSIEIEIEIRCLLTLWFPPINSKIPFISDIEISWAMSHKFYLEFDHSWITRKGPNLVHTPGFGPKGKGSFDRRKCYSYVIKDRNEITAERVQLVPVVHHQYPWLFGPATLLSSRSIVYPC